MPRGQKEPDTGFAAGGGRHWDAREQRGKRLREVTTREKELCDRLADLAAGDLPLALVPDLLSQVEAQDDKERQAADAALVGRLLAERDEQLLEVLRGARASGALVRKVGAFLDADRAARQPGASGERRLELSERGRFLLRHLRGRQLLELREEAHGILEQLARVSQEREDLEREDAATPPEDKVRDVAAAFRETTQILAVLNAEAGQLDLAVGAARTKLEEVEGKLRQLWQGKMEEEFAHEDARRMMELAGRTRETMQAFLTRVTERKIDRLSALITESFRFLLRKETLVERITIDPGTFAITLFGMDGQTRTKIGRAEFSHR